jgi:hypothetical protein
MQHNAPLLTALEQRLARLEAAADVMRSSGGAEGDTGSSVLLNRIGALENAMREQHIAVLELLAIQHDKGTGASGLPPPPLQVDTSQSARAKPQPINQTDAATQTTPATRPIPLPPLYVPEPAGRWEQPGPSPLGKSSSTTEGAGRRGAGRSASNQAGAPGKALDPAHEGSRNARRSAATARGPEGGVGSPVDRNTSLPPIRAPRGALRQIGTPSTTDSTLRQRRAAFAGTPKGSGQTATGAAMAAAKRELARAGAKTARSVQAEA